MSCSSEITPPRTRVMTAPPPLVPRNPLGRKRHQQLLPTYEVPPDAQLWQEGVVTIIPSAASDMHRPVNSPFPSAPPNSPFTLPPRRVGYTITVTNPSPVPQINDDDSSLDDGDDDYQQEAVEGEETHLDAVIRRLEPQFQSKVCMPPRKIQNELNLRDYILNTVEFGYHCEDRLNDKLELCRMVKSLFLPLKIEDDTLIDELQSLTAMFMCGLQKNWDDIAQLIRVGDNNGFFFSFVYRYQPLREHPQYYSIYEKLLAVIRLGILAMQTVTALRELFSSDMFDEHLYYANTELHTIRQCMQHDVSWDTFLTVSAFKKNE